MADNQLENIAEKETKHFKTSVKDLIPLYSFYQFHKAAEFQNRTRRQTIEGYVVCAIWESVKLSAYTLGALGTYSLLNK